MPPPNALEVLIIARNEANAELERLKATINSVSQNANLPGKMLGQGMDEANYKMRDARGSLQLTKKILDIDMPRAVQTALASIGSVGTVMAAAFYPLAIFYLIKALAEIPQHISNAIDWIEGFGKAIADSAKGWEEHRKGMQEVLKLQRELLEEQDRYSLLGLEGSAKARRQAEIDARKADEAARAKTDAQLRYNLLLTRSKERELVPHLVPTPEMTAAERAKELLGGQPPVRYSMELTETAKAVTASGELQKAREALKTSDLGLQIAEQKLASSTKEVRLAEAEEARKTFDEQRKQAEQAGKLNDQAAKKAAALQASQLRDIQSMRMANILDPVEARLRKFAEDEKVLWSYVLGPDPKVAKDAASALAALFVERDEFIENHIHDLDVAAEKATEAWKKMLPPISGPGSPLEGIVAGISKKAPAMGEYSPFNFSDMDRKLGIIKTAVYGVNEGFRDMFRGIGEGTVNAAAMFQNLAAAAIDAMGRMITQMFIVNVLMKAMSALFGFQAETKVGAGNVAPITTQPPLYGQWKTHDYAGPAYAGQTYKIGVPEIFTPATDGWIQPMTTQSGDIKVNLINQSSQPVQAKAKQKFDARGAVVEIFLSDLETNGAIAQAIKSYR